MCAVSKNKTRRFDIAVAIYLCGRNQCTALFEALQHLHENHLNLYAVFIYYLISFYSKSLLYAFLFKIKWNDVLRFNWNKTGKVYI